MAKETADNITGTDVLEAPQKSNVTFNDVLKVPEKTSRIFLLANDKRQGRVSIDLEEDVIDPQTGKTRRMRLLRGAQSIWFDEQPPNVFPEKYVNKNVLTMEFEQGKCVIPVTDKLKLQAAELTNRNTGNKNRQGHKDIYFYEWDPIEQNKKNIEEENDVIKAMQLAMTTPVEEMIPHANYLNIQFADEQGVELNEESLRAAYIRKAKNEAKKFLNSIHSPTVKISFMVKKAITGGKIDLGKQPGAAYWVDGGFISTLPEGRDAAAYLTEFAMTHGEANAAFQNQLREFS
jgi:hypothetical protein